MPKYTPSEYQNQRRGADTGALTGAAAGWVGGWKAGKAPARVRTAARGAKSSYQGSRSLSRMIGEGSRIKDAGTALKTGAASLKAPKRAGGLASLGTAYVGSIAGSVGGAHGGRKLVRRSQDKKKLAKSSTISAFGVDHGR